MPGVLIAAIVFCTVLVAELPDNSGLASLVLGTRYRPGGDVDFLKTTADLRYYHEITDGVVGIVRGQGGAIAPWGGQQLPLMDGFFGSPQLVRAP